MQNLEKIVRKHVTLGLTPEPLLLDLTIGENQFLDVETNFSQIHEARIENIVAELEKLYHYEELKENDTENMIDYELEEIAMNKELSERY